MNAIPEEKLSPSGPTMTSDPTSLSGSNGAADTPEADIRFEKEVIEFGRKIFNRIGKEQPGAFNKNFWSGKIMEWSMNQPELKLNLFRLVDVLPSLRSSAAIARHVNEYLGPVAGHVHGLMEWGVNVKPHSMRAKVTSFAVRNAVKQTAAQFIAGETPQGALKQLKKTRKQGLCFTVDLLGEFSHSEKEALEYLERYMEALDVFGKNVPKWKESAPIVKDHPGESSPVCISVKLSALYSQCNVLNIKRSVEVLSERLSIIASKAKEIDALLYVDAEDIGNNPIIYQTFKNVFGKNGSFADFPYPGIVVQAYAKDSPAIIDDLIQFAKDRNGPIAVRLVKGAYWDFETVVSSQNNWPSPLFHKKSSTDANYERLTRVLMDNYQHCLPAIGSHNVRSLSYACCYAQKKGLSNTDFELQMLYGMAEPIAKAFAREDLLVRLYVPLGDMIPGMGYLVRRLLENTSNESFLRHTFFDESEVDSLLQKPVMAEG